MTFLRSSFDAGLTALCAAAFALAAVLMMPGILENSDLYWHIAAGRWTIENYAVLRIDPFSYTYAGQAWHSLEWLSQLLLATAYVGAGLGGVMALAALATGISAGLLTFYLSRFWQGLLLLGGLVLAFLTAGGAISAEPYLLALPFAVAFVAGLANARAERRRPYFILLPLLLFWANLHASFVLGLLLTLALGIEAVIETRNLQVARDWLVFAGYALIISLITPYGGEGLVHALRALFVPVQQPIQSMMPLLLALPATAVLLRRWQTLMRAACVALLFVLALYFPAERLLFAALTPLLAAEALSETRITPQFATRPALALVLISLIALAARAFLPFAAPDSGVRPAQALNHVPAAVQRAPVLNDIAFGGYLITRDIKPFIDSRSVYSTAFRTRFAELGDPAVLMRVVKRYHIRWTLLAPSNPAVKTLDHLPGWKRLYSDPYAVVHVKAETL